MYYFADHEEQGESRICTSPNRKTASTRVILNINLVFILCPSKNEVGFKITI
jgi:hypothetical protein